MSFTYIINQGLSKQTHFAIRFTKRYQYFRPSLKLDIIDHRSSDFLIPGGIFTPRYKLENDAFCGKTPYGREECFWGCEIEIVFIKGIGNGPVIKSPECLMKCFDKVRKNQY